MNYQHAKAYLDSFIDYERLSQYSYQAAYRLERFQSFLEILHHPQEGIKFLQVAGTKGKGSTCAFIAHILKEAGFRTGLYTSPHLVDPRERIRILDTQSPTDFSGMISKKEISRCITRLKPAIERFNKTSPYGVLSFFEVYTALALSYFKKKKVDFAVLETGLGGRLDATNAINALVCGITPISYEHTQLLGKTLSQIAGEKAGIIKTGKQIVVSAPQSKGAKRIIEARCKKLRVPLFLMGREILYKKIKTTPRYQTFQVKSFLGQYPALKSRLLGKHQIINASLAIGMIEALTLQDIFIRQEAVSRGIYAARWPGRFEIATERPLVVLDGAQNVASIRALKETLKEVFGSKKIILVLGISQDKDLKGICRQLAGVAKEIILTAADNPRATRPEFLQTFFPDRNKLTLTKNVRQAMDLAFKRTKDTDLILVTGSLFVVGEARKICLG